MLMVIRDEYMSQLNRLRDLETSGSTITNITRNADPNTTELPTAMFDFPKVPGPDILPEILNSYKENNIDPMLLFSALDPRQKDASKIRTCYSFATEMRSLSTSSGAAAATTAYEAGQVYESAQANRGASITLRRISHNRPVNSDSD
jgi:hypothetical protein